MPYRIDLPHDGADTLDRLVDLGALDVEVSPDGGLAALMPDAVAPEQVASLLGLEEFLVSPARGRDGDSIWLLSPRPTRVGRIRIVPAASRTEPDAIRLIDAPAFGTGLHPTTALCLELLQDIVESERPDAVLDVGTGSGVLALAALAIGVSRAAAIDVDEEALCAAADNARINGMSGRVMLARAGPDGLRGTWPLVVANILAAPLIELAPDLVRRVGHRGRLVLSGIASSLEEDVDDAYRRLGMRRSGIRARDRWVAIVMRPSW